MGVSSIQPTDPGHGGRAGGAGAQGHFLRGDEGVGSQWLLFLIRHSTGLSREQGVNGMDRV